MLVVTSINGKLIIQLEWPNPNTKEIRCTGRKRETTFLEIFMAHKARQTDNRKYSFQG